LIDLVDANKNDILDLKVKKLDMANKKETRDGEEEIKIN